MPELPEVETTRRGIEPHIEDKKVSKVILRRKTLRWPITPALSQDLPGETFKSVSRRGKYLLLATKKGTLLIHLGMSGSLRIVDTNRPAAKHDHVDIVLTNNKVLRYTDPRRFGCMLWVTEFIESHPLLASLGPEPLSDNFHPDYLFKKSRTRNVTVKTFIMDSKVVVGVGNIYANESLFLAGINPKRSAGKISKPRYVKLVACIQQVLQRAIDVGGTTLRDFTDSNGEPGYFAQSLHVYGRKGEPCHVCKSTLKESRQGQRSTVYCCQCQK
ncbi:MAG: DNA-formamidopyrimidine glycosylase [SAR86 cluster bacterium]|uniref:Formamidopyrimidine-DNA glycosylase n=1 Tax=SAR86 cluster bacterium TaxID=2030880 RepID=A0A2A4X215_9GAMM|nr:MAG: DNA-formamidopyrimidine glycosylase [SAR86 cluster bacterium]